MNDKVYASKTAVKRGPEKGVRREAVIELHSWSGQPAHFSMIYDEYYYGHNVSGGYPGLNFWQKYFPEWVKYDKWHSVHVEKGPWYYIENSMYWLGRRGWRNRRPDSPPNLDHFKSTVRWGEVASDAEMDPASLVYDNLAESNLDDYEVAQILANRFPALMDAFYTDMIELFGAEAVNAAREDARVYLAEQEATRNAAQES